MRVRRRFASDALPCIEISSGILTVSSHHYAIGWLLKMTEQPGRASLRDIRARDHAYPCVCTKSASPSSRARGVYEGRGGAGDTRHEAEKLNPSEKYFPAVGLLPFSSILPYKLPRPALPHACSSRTRSQELRLWAHRACDAWHQPTPSWVRRGGCRIADMGIGQLDMQQLAAVADMVAPRRMVL